MVSASVSGLHTSAILMPAQISMHLYDKSDILLQPPNLCVNSPNSELTRERQLSTTTRTDLLYRVAFEEMSNKFSFTCCSKREVSQKATQYSNSVLVTLSFRSYLSL